MLPRRFAARYAPDNTLCVATYNFTIYLTVPPTQERRPGFMNTMHQERRSLDEEGAYVSGSGSGCGSGSGSGDGLESGDCKQPEEELEECLIDPMVPITTTTGESSLCTTYACVLHNIQACMCTYGMS